MKTLKRVVRPRSAARKVCPHCGSVLLPKADQDLDLTPRQKEVLRLIAGGYTAQQIADTLGLSRRTAEFHRMMLMERLGLHTTAELTLYAAAHELT